MRAALRLLVLGLSLAAPLHADNLEAREARLAMQLRCVVCQNQTVAESNAPLAADMRRVIHTQLESGRSEQQVVEFFEQRYGAFVHYSPPLRPSTWLLWSAPFLLLAAGLAILSIALRRRSQAGRPNPLSDAQRLRAHRLLEQDIQS